MKAIETEYNGVLFRSRLEARWAVFFDALELKYVYEPECFELSSGQKYTPDFYIPKWEIYLEIKPNLDWFSDLKHKSRYDSFDKILIVLSGSYPDLSTSSYINNNLEPIVFCPKTKYEPLFATGLNLGETESLFNNQWDEELKKVKQHRFWK